MGPSTRTRSRARSASTIRRSSIIWRSSNTMMSSRRARARTPTAPSSSSRTKWNGMRSSSVRFSQVSTGRRGRPGVQTRRRRACESYRNDGLEGKSTTVIAQAMGGGQPEDTSARNSRVAGQHPQPSPRRQDVVLGSRFLGKMAEGAMSNLNRVGNRILSALARLLFGVSVTDVCTGMWAFNADTLRELSLEARGFDLEADLFGSAALKEARITELPIDYAARIGPPKLIPLRTGLKIALRLFKRRLNGPSTSPEHRSKPSRASTTS